MNNTKYVIARVSPAFAGLAPSIDFLEMWKDEDTEKYYFGYVPGNYGPKTQFDSLEYAETVLLHAQTSNFYKHTNFVIIPFQTVGDLVRDC